jgi:quercetin dioxygenase-like cupin family protein
MNGSPHGATGVVVPEQQRAVWFLGGLVRVRVGGDGTGGALAILEHEAERGYGCPAHRHGKDEETILVLEGTVEVEVDGHARIAGPGSVAVLPPAVPHAFVVVSPTARFLTVHTPAGYDQLVLLAGTEAFPPYEPLLDQPLPEAGELRRMAAGYGIEFLDPAGGYVRVRRADASGAGEPWGDDEPYPLS